MKLVFNSERGEACIHEIEPLAREHALEIRSETDGYMADVGWYIQHERAGSLVFYSARVPGSMELVGYATVLYNADQLHNGDLSAITHLVFLRKEWRKGLTGVQFLNYIERDAARRGAHCIYQSTTPSNDFSGVLEYMGYQLATITHSKTLEKSHGD